MTTNQALKIVKPIRLLDPKSDLVFKKIFGQHPKLIKSFLNGILPLPEGRLIESIEYLTPEQVPDIPEMKNTIVDVKCTDQHGRIFIVEMQMVWDHNFIKRFLFGTSKAYVQQLSVGEQYENLCPVYGLAIINEAFENTTEDWFHHYRLTNVKDLGRSLEGLEMIFLELPKFRPQTLEHKKIGLLWLRFLRDFDKFLDEIPEEFRDDPDIAMALELAQESSYTREELIHYDGYLDAVRTIEMVHNGLIRKGREEGKVNAIKLMISGGIQLEKISEIMGWSMDELHELK